MYKMMWWKKLFGMDGSSAPLGGGLGQPREERMRLEWARKEFRVELAPDVEGMPLELDNLHEGIVRARARNAQAALFDGVAVAVVEFEPVPVAFGNLPLPVK